MTTIGITITMLLLIVVLCWLWRLYDRLDDIICIIKAMDKRETHDQHITEQMILENRRMIDRQEDDGK